MKKIIMSLMAFSLVLAVKAQEIPERKTDAPHHGMHDRKEGMKRHNGMAFKNLNLSEEQKGKMKMERENMQKKMVDLKSNEDITVREWKSRQEKIHQDFKSRIEGILTADQKAQLEKNKLEGKEKQKEFGSKRAAMMKEKLGLTDDQADKMKKNHEDMMGKMKTIREDKALTEEKKKEAIKGLMKEQHEKTKSILTEEQMQKMKEGRKEGRDGRERRKPDAKESK